MNDARRPTAAEHCRYLAEFAGNFAVVVELDHLFHDDVHAAVGGGFRQNPDLDPHCNETDEPAHLRGLDIKFTRRRDQ